MLPDGLLIWDEASLYWVLVAFGTLFVTLNINKYLSEHLACNHYNVRVPGAHKGSSCVYVQTVATN